MSCIKNILGISSYSVKKKKVFGGFFDPIKNKTSYESKVYPESILNEYFSSQKTQENGLPTVGYCADQLNISANYLGDLIKRETGMSAIEHIQLKLMDVAKERLFDTKKTVSEVAYELGFKYPQHFSRLFKKRIGITPNEYRDNPMS